MWVMPEHRSVVVGVDGSPNSLAALRRAAREALERHARLDVVRVLEPDAGTTPRPLRTAREWLRLREHARCPIVICADHTTASEAPRAPEESPRRRP